jgi:hypothetical protein
MDLHQGKQSILELEAPTPLVGDPIIWPDFLPCIVSLSYDPQILFNKKSFSFVLLHHLH